MTEKTKRGRGKQKVEPLRSTGHPALDLLAATISLAIVDAKRGDSDAAAWLADVCPSWRYYDSREKRTGKRRRNKYI